MQIFSKPNKGTTRIRVDGQVLDVPFETTASDILGACGKDTDTRSLTTTDGKGNMMQVPGSQRVRLVDGQEFHTALHHSGG